MQFSNDLVESMALICAAGLMLFAAWQDFMRWRIPNGTVLALIGVYGVLGLFRWLNGDAPTNWFYGDLAAGLTLFVTGFALWALRLMGAGDAKFFLPVGLFVGFSYLVPFGFVLAIGGIVIALALKFPLPITLRVWPLIFRLDEIRKSRKVPYGVLIAVAALVSMYLRYASGA